MIKVLLTMLFFFSAARGSSLLFPPTPNEDSLRGLNSNCYLSAIGHPTKKERDDFINTLRPYIDSICQKLYLPSKTVMAMTILESNFGFTRTGYFANNLFGIKTFTNDSVKVYVLKGQPDESNGRNIKIIARTSAGQLIFEEGLRKDNRYRKFDSKQSCILYLAGTLLQNRRYKICSENYKANRRKGVSELEASLIYAHEIASNGYNHLGGEFYRNSVEKIIRIYKL